MLPGDPVLTVLLYGTLAAVTATAGALPFAVGSKPRESWIGAGDAVASGLMLGAAYLLAAEGLERGAVATVGGAVGGVAFTYLTQVWAGLDRLSPAPDHDGGPDAGYKTILQNTLHSASEGIAIGVAMVVELRLGIFMALALAVHNVGEGLALSQFLHHRGMAVADCAGLCAVTKISQPLLAVAAFAVTPAVSGFLPSALGFAAGALLFLVLSELAPASYQRTSKTVVAVLLSTATAAVVLLEELFG